MSTDFKFKVVDIVCEARVVVGHIHERGGPVPYQSNLELSSYPNWTDPYQVAKHKRVISKKKAKWFMVGARKGTRKGKLPRVNHELAEVSIKSGVAPVPLEGESVHVQANSSSLFSAGTVLCADSVSSSDIRFCNNKFWVLQSKSVARKMWERAKSLGVEGSHVDDNYIDLIEVGERRDEDARKKLASNIGAP